MSQSVNINLDRLINYLLEEVALCGGEGASTTDVLDFIKAFHFPEGRNKNTINGALKLAHPQHLDSNYLSQVWKWLSQHQDIRVGEEGQGNDLDLAQVEAHNATINVALITSMDAKNKAASHPTENLQVGILVDNTTRPNILKIYTSEEQIWLAAAGHRKDLSKIQPLDFACLSIIAAQRDKGILQPALVKETGQDPRSLPSRTQRLHNTGYIVKMRVMAQGSRTSLLILRKFASAPNPMVGHLLIGQSRKIPREEISNDVRGKLQGRIWEAMELLRDSRQVSWYKLVEQSGLWRNPAMHPAFKEIFKYLERLGCIKLQPPQVEPVLPIWPLDMDVAYLREPTRMEWRDAFGLGMGGHSGLAKGENHSKSPSEASQKTAHQGTEEGRNQWFDTAEEDLNGDSPSLTRKRRKYYFRAVWDPDRLLCNIILEVVQRAKCRGLTLFDIRERVVGRFYQKPIEHQMSRLVDFWQLSQPSNLYHLALIRDTIQIGRTNQASWEPVHTIVGAQPASLPTDEHGFPKLERSIWTTPRNATSVASSLKKSLLNSHKSSKDCPSNVRLAEPRVPSISGVKFKAPKSQLGFRKCSSRTIPSTRKRQDVPRKTRGRPRKYLESHQPTEPENRNKENLNLMLISQQKGKKYDSPNNLKEATKENSRKLTRHVGTNVLFMSGNENGIDGLDRASLQEYETSSPPVRLTSFATRSQPELPVSVEAIRCVSSSATHSGHFQPGGEGELAIGTLEYEQPTLATGKPTIGYCPSPLIHHTSNASQYNIPACTLVGGRGQHLHPQDLPPLGVGLQRSRRSRTQSNGEHPRIFSLPRLEKAVNSRSAQLGSITSEEPGGVLTRHDEGHNLAKNSAQVSIGTAVESRGDHSNACKMEPKLIIFKSPRLNSFLSSLSAHIPGSIATEGLPLPARTATEITRECDLSKLNATLLPPSDKVYYKDSRSGIEAANMAIPSVQEGSTGDDEGPVSTDSTDISRSAVQDAQCYLTPPGCCLPFTAEPVGTDEQGIIRSAPSTSGSLQPEPNWMKRKRALSSKELSQDPCISKNARLGIKLRSRTNNGDNSDSGHQKFNAEHLLSKPLAPVKGIMLNHSTNLMDAWHNRIIDGSFLSTDKCLYEIDPRKHTTTNAAIVRLSSNEANFNGNESRIRFSNTPDLRQADGKSLSMLYRSFNNSIDLSKSVPEDMSSTEVTNRISHESTAASSSLLKMRPSGGSVAAQRRQIIMDIVQESGGVCPGDNELWYPFASIWMAKAEGLKPDYRTIKIAKKALIDSGKLRQVKFSYVSKAGMMVTKSILTLLDISPEDRKVRYLQERMIAEDPRYYFPGGIEISSNIKNQFANQKGVCDELIEGGHRLNANDESTDRRGKAARKVTSETDTARDGNRLSGTEASSHSFATHRGKAKPVPVSIKPNANSALTDSRSDITLALDIKNPSSQVVVAEAKGRNRDRMITHNEAYFMDGPPDMACSSYSRNSSLTLHPEGSRKGIHNPNPGQPSATPEPGISGIGHSLTSKNCKNTQRKDSRTTKDVKQAKTGQQFPKSGPLDMIMKYDERGFGGNERIQSLLECQDHHQPSSKSKLAGLIMARAQVSPKSQPEPRFVSKDRKRKASQVTSKSQRSTSPLDMLSGSLTKIPAQSCSVSNKKLKLQGFQNDQNNDGLARSILIAVLIIRTITGGVGQAVDWKLVSSIMAPEYSRHTIRHIWMRICGSSRSIFPKLQSVFQEQFSQAYKDGIIPLMSFQNLEGYDWKTLHAWSLKILDPLIPRHWPRSNHQELEEKVEFPQITQLDVLDYYESTGRATLPRRHLDLHKHAYFLPLRDAKTNRELLDVIDVAKSWICATVVTPEGYLDPGFARNKLLSLGEEIVKEAIGDLLTRKILNQETKGRLNPGRNYDLSDSYVSRLRTNLEAHHFQQALSYKTLLDKSFGSGTEVLLSNSADDGVTLAVINLIAKKRILIQQQGVPANRLGLVENGYLTRKMDRTRLNFLLKLIPTTTYQKNKCLRPVFEAPRVKPQFDPEGQDITLSPIWYDINGKVVPAMWDIARTAVLSTMALRPGMNAGQVRLALGHSLELFEIDLIMAWLVTSGLGESNGPTDGVVSLKESWWMFLEFATEHV